MKKILVISSSLRRNSNSDALAEAFAKGAAEAGNEVETITLKGKELHFCTGCLACQKTSQTMHRPSWIKCMRRMSSLLLRPYTTMR